MKLGKIQVILKFILFFLCQITIRFFKNLLDHIITVEGKKIKTKIFLSLLLADKKDTYLAARKKGSNYSKLKQACYTCEIPGEELDSFQELYSIHLIFFIEFFLFLNFHIFFFFNILVRLETLKR